MSDSRSDAATRRPRFGLLAALVTLALVVGIALMIYAVRRSGGWFVQQPVATEPAATRAADYLPPQPATAVTAAIDPAILAARESGLAAQLSALESRTAAVALDARSAAGQAGRAESLLVVAAARRAIERGAQLGALEDQLRTRFGASQPRAVAAVIASARQPLTLEDLREGFDLRAGVLASGGDGDLLSSLSRELRTLVVVHDEAKPSPLPSDRIARARRLLDAGRVDRALAEVARLPGVAQASGWVALARRYVRTREGLDVLESAALIAPAPVSIVPPPPVAPPPTSGVATP